MHLCSFGVLDCCSSAQRSLMAVREESLLTFVLMHRFLRDPRVRCFRSSMSVALVFSSCTDGGKWTRRSSLMNCVSWECVREQ